MIYCAGKLWLYTWRLHTRFTQILSKTIVKLNKI
jgi:hypothetical protein